MKRTALVADFFNRKLALVADSSTIYKKNHRPTFKRMRGAYCIWHKSQRHCFPPTSGHHVLSHDSDSVQMQDWAALNTSITPPSQTLH